MTQLQNLPNSRYNSTDSGVQLTNTQDAFDSKIQEARATLLQAGTAGRTTVVLDANGDGVAEKRAELSAYGLDISNHPSAERLRGQFRVNTNTVSYGENGSAEGATVTHERQVLSQFKNNKVTLAYAQNSGQAGADGSITYGGVQHAPTRTLSTGQSGEPDQQQPSGGPVEGQGNGAGGGEPVAGQGDGSGQGGPVEGNNGGGGEQLLTNTAPGQTDTAPAQGEQKETVLKPDQIEKEHALQTGKIIRNVVDGGPDESSRAALSVDIDGNGQPDINITMSGSTYTPPGENDSGQRYVRIDAETTIRNPEDPQGAPQVVKEYSVYRVDPEAPGGYTEVDKVVFGPDGKPIPKPGGAS